MNNHPAAQGALRPLPAHYGIHLESDATTMSVQPRLVAGLPPENQKPFPMPRLPSCQLERVAGILRSFWQQKRRALVALLYLSLRTRKWVAFFPPQFAGPDASRWSFTFEKESRQPRDHLRLAGSVCCRPGISAEIAVASAPPFDGLHVAIDPAAAWVAATFVICSQGQHHLTIAEKVISELHQRSWNKHLIGIIVLKANVQNTAFAVPAADIREFLNPALNE